MCYLTGSGAADFDLFIMQGISTSYRFIYYVAFIDLDLPVSFRQRAIAITGMVGLLGACGVFHAILICLFRQWHLRWMGYLVTSGMIIVLVSVWHLMVSYCRSKVREIGILQRKGSGIPCDPNCRSVDLISKAGMKFFLKSFHLFLNRWFFYYVL